LAGFYFLLVLISSSTCAIMCSIFVMWQYNYTVQSSIQSNFWHHSVTYLGCVTVDGVLIDERIYWPLVYTTWNYTLQIADTETNVLSLLQSPLAISWQWPLPVETLQLPAFRSSLPPVQNSLSTDNSTNWVPCWQPFHTNPLVFSSQADFRLNSLTNQLLHVTSLDWTADNINQQLTYCQSQVALQLAVYCQSVHPGVKPVSTEPLWQ
jgi:hypothetical protein